MGNDQKDVAIKKYNAIAKANRMMFGAVALASVVAGAAVVGKRRKQFVRSCAVG